MSGVDQNEDTMRSKDHAPGSSEVKASAASKDKRSFKESAVLRISALAPALSAVFPGAASANDSQSVVQPRAERVGAPNLQVDVDTHSAISPDAIEKTPVAKPTATPRPTTLPAVESSRVVVAAFPTPTTTPISPDVQASQVFTESLTTEPEVKASEIYVANIEVGANLRAGAGTKFEVVDSVQQDKNRELQLVDFDTTMALTSYNWFRLTGVLDENGNPVDVYVRGDLIRDVTLVKAQDAGPNTGGAVVPPEESRKEQEVTIEQLAMLIDPVTFTGSDPLAFTDLVPKSEAEMRVNRALVQIALMHSGLNEKQLLEAMNNHERVVINLPAQRQDRQADRSPSWLGKPQPVLVDLQLGMNISFNKTEYEARQIAEQDVVIKSQSPDMSGANPTDLRLVCRDENGNETDEICGVYTTLGDSRSFNYLYVDRDGKLNLVVGEVDGYSRMTYPHHYLIAIAYSDLIEDEVDENGKATRYFLLFGFNETYQDGSPTLIGDTLVDLPKALQRGPWYDTDDAYTEYVNMLIEYEHQ